MVKTLKLESKATITLTPKPPFHFDGTFHKPSHFPDPLKIYEKGKYWQAIRVGEKIFGLRVENKGSLQRPKLKITVYYNGEPFL